MLLNSAAVAPLFYLKLAIYQDNAIFIILHIKKIFYKKNKNIEAKLNIKKP